MDNLVTNIQGYSIHDGPGIRTVVFLKGCGLECRWCSNPECISSVPEIGFIKTLCTKCSNCADICPTGALVLSEDSLPIIDRKLCTGCGKCSEICTYGAIVQYGKQMDADEIYDAVSRDKMFYDSSGGGVTISGGEALLQPQLVCDVFTRCRQSGIHTCFETSGYVSSSAIYQVLPFTDFILFDLKIINSKQHSLYTGKSNNLILSNAEIVINSSSETLFRMPLLPGINDDVQNINDTADFLLELGQDIRRIELMPYHRLGKGKYESLGREYTLPDIPVPEPEYIERVKKTFENFGITCLVSK